MFKLGYVFKTRVFKGDTQMVAYRGNLPGSTLGSNSLCTPSGQKPHNDDYGF